MKKGLILGRFQPFHLGHLTLIKNANLIEEIIKQYSERNLEEQVEQVIEKKYVKFNPFWG